MTAMLLKIVPVDAPNADGIWIEHDVPPGVDVYDVVPREGFHVVQAVGERYRAKTEALADLERYHREVGEGNAA
jgi:hypothetical protein